MLWEKEKLLIMSNFAFSHRVFQTLLLQKHKNMGLFEKGLRKIFLSSSNALNLVNPFPNKPGFLHVCSTCLLITLWEKEKLLVTSNFSFFHCVIYRFQQLSAIFFKFRIVVCKVFKFGRV